jgi:hypothetical protein
MQLMISNQPPFTTASGIASGRQLVELTTATGLLLDMTAAPRPLVIFVPFQAAPAAVLAMEEAADELDMDIARKRLAEINETPARLVQGEQLRERLAMIKS